MHVYFILLYFLIFFLERLLLPLSFLIYIQHQKKECFLRVFLLLRANSLCNKVLYWPLSIKKAAGRVRERKKNHIDYSYEANTQTAKLKLYTKIDDKNTNTKTHIHS